MMPATRLLRRLLLCCLFLSSTVARAQNQEVLGEYRIGIIGRDGSDAVYHAFHKGASDAARDLAVNDSIDIELFDRTPQSPDPEAQIEAVSQLFVEEADGIVISPVDPAALQPVLTFVSGQGVEVVLFEATVEDFNPLASFPADETEAGRLAGLAALKEMPRSGRAAILIDRNADANMRARLDGIRSSLGYRRIYGIVECEPDYNSAIEAIQQATEADVNDLIGGWIFLDDWPLLGLPALPWKPGKGDCVAIQSSPSTLMYLEREYIDALIVHPYYEWGYESVKTLIDKLHKGTDPEEAVILLPPQTIDWRNIDTYRANWTAWMKED